MKRKLNVIERDAPQPQNSGKIRESLPYIGFVRPSDSVTEEQAKQINSKLYSQAHHTYQIMKRDGYSSDLEGYRKDGIFISTQDAHRLCKDKLVR